MAPTLIPIESFNMVGVTTFAEFQTKTSALPQLFDYRYYGPTGDTYQNVDTGKTYAGLPSVFFTYRNTPEYTGGWYSSKSPIDGGYSALYLRNRFELSSTFDPQNTTDSAGLLLSTIYISYDGYGYDMSKIVLNEGRVRMVFYQNGSYADTVVDIGPASLIRGAPLQLLHLVELSGGDIRTRVYLGDATDAQDDLTLLLDRTDTPTDAATTYLYDADSFYGNFITPASNDFRLWLYTTEFGTYTNETPVYRDYARIVDGIVADVVTDAIMPPNTSTAFYYELLPGDPVPEVGWYFSDVCGTFSATPPTIPAGDIAPPYTPGTTPPVPGDPDYPVSADPDSPIVYAEMFEVPVPFHVRRGETITVTAGSEVDARVRVHYPLNTLCGIRLQAHVVSATSDVVLTLKASIDNGATWAYVNDAAGGPLLSCYKQGDVVGGSVAPDGALALLDKPVLLSLFAEGSGTAQLGNVHGMALYRATDGACQIGEECDAFTGARVELTGAGNLFSDRFDYGSTAEMVAAGYDGDGFGQVTTYECNGTRGIKHGTSSFLSLKNVALTGTYSELWSRVVIDFSESITDWVPPTSDAWLFLPVASTGVFSGIAISSGSLISWHHATQRVHIGWSEADGTARPSGTVNPITWAAFTTPGQHVLVSRTTMIPNVFSPTGYSAFVETFWDGVAMNSGAGGSFATNAWGSHITMYCSQLTAEMKQYSLIRSVEVGDDAGGPTS